MNIARIIAPAIVVRPLLTAFQRDGHTPHCVYSRNLARAEIRFLGANEEPDKKGDLAGAEIDWSEEET